MMLSRLAVLYICGFSSFICHFLLIKQSLTLLVNLFLSNFTAIKF
ncbi:Uncharacterised protein [Vibrio metschnikovii]|nr:Uncharacterised protein [Vibrio metschnikovii]SUP51365.1 Uncharacterised protein [Vibrio metschnikovii]